MKGFGILVILSIIGVTVTGKGAKTYGDSCNLIASGIQIFSSDSNYAEACDTEKNLVCAINECTCPPGFRWDQNIFGKLVGLGGNCVVNSGIGLKSGWATIL